MEAYNRNCVELRRLESADGPGHRELTAAAIVAADSIAAATTLEQAASEAEAGQAPRDLATICELYLSE